MIFILLKIRLITAFASGDCLPEVVKGRISRQQDFRNTSEINPSLQNSKRTVITPASCYSSRKAKMLKE